MPEYAVVKAIHQSAVALSFVGFFARGVGAWAGAAWVQGRAAKTLPPLVDTVLLISALTLAFVAGLNPLSTPWLLTKISALILYILLGVAALKPGLARGRRTVAFVLALATFGFIVSVAITKRPIGYFAWVY